MASSRRQRQPAAHAELPFLPSSVDLTVFGEGGVHVTASPCPVLQTPAGFASAVTSNPDDVAQLMLLFESEQQQQALCGMEGVQAAVDDLDVFAGCGLQVPTFAPSVTVQPEVEREQPLQPLGVVTAPPHAGVSQTIGLSGGESGRKLPARVMDNDKRLLDAQWSEDLLCMPTAELNEWLKTSGLTPKQQDDLKKARRRKQNRVYQRRARVKRISKHSRLEADHERESERNQELERAVAEQRRILEADRVRSDRILDFVRSLRDSGRISAAELAEVLKA